jgi:hypothetical protein
LDEIAGFGLSPFLAWYQTCRKHGIYQLLAVLSHSPPALPASKHYFVMNGSFRPKLPLLVSILKESRGLVFDLNGSAQQSCSTGSYWPTPVITLLMLNDRFGVKWPFYLAITP